jgi:hypothetical protein
MNTTAGARTARGIIRTTVLGCAVLAAGAGLLLVAGCSGGTSSSSASGPPANASAAFGNGSAPVPAAPGKFSASSAGGAASQAGQLLLSPQSIIYTASLVVQSRDVEQAAAAAASLAQAAGGYVSGEKAASSGKSGSGTVSLTLKIPVAAYQAALGRLAGLGRQVSLDQQSTDATQQVADVASRVISQQAAIGQLRVLLSRAGSVSQLLSVQDQINAGESALEALQAQQRALAHETTYGTVSLVLVSQQRHFVKRKKKAASGFLTGLSRGWHTFALAVTWLLTALGAVLPFAAIAAVLGALGYAARRRQLRRRAGPSAT